MLTELHIEHLGVIANLDLVLGPGLTVLTGETGAGKTMLIGAINLLVGGRADATLIRPGAEEARVEGRFVIGDEELVLARVIPADGRSRAYVNGRLATVGNLATEGSRLIDLHGQHAHQSLLATAVQRAALDRFGKVDLEPLRLARARLTEIDASLAALGGDVRSRAREIDLLKFQVRELGDAELVDADEDQQLEAKEELLSGAQAHREAAFAALEALSADGGALDTLGTSIAALGQRMPFSGEEARLRGLVSELSDVAAELRDRAESIDDDPERLAELRERRQLLRELQRKYGETLAEVIAYFAETSERLEELESYEARAAALEVDRVKVVAQVAKAAAQLGAARRAAAPKLAATVAKHLASLAMPKARVEIEIGDDPGDDVTFLLGANPGEPAHPLAKVASGGELARSMLALRLVLTEAPETLVFDEVDAGIGGSAAVGRSLAELGERHQVLVVTHLAQVAALADHQIVVSKRVGAGRTTAHAEVVCGEDRIEELARMLSGSADSPAAREHAAELLRSTPRGSQASSNS
jgi:DNA repair protein RecN (Recombination protein N)